MIRLSMVALRDVMGLHHGHSVLIVVEVDSGNVEDGVENGHIVVDSMIVVDLWSEHNEVVSMSSSSRKEKEGFTVTDHQDVEGTEDDEVVNEVDLANGTNGLGLTLPLRGRTLVLLLISHRFMRSHISSRKVVVLESIRNGGVLKSSQSGQALRIEVVVNL
jgi:hypothetical protein